MANVHLSLDQRTRYCISSKNEKSVLDKVWVKSMQCVEYVQLPKGSPLTQQMEWKDRLAFIVEDLQDLLLMSFEQFWCQIINESSVMRCVDSYLKNAPRWYDTDHLEIPTDAHSLHAEIHRLVFMVLVRITSTNETKDDFITPNIFGEIIYENFIWDIPRLMDLCVLYAADNAEYVTKMIQNIVSNQPNYRDDLRSTLTTIGELFGRLCEEMDVSVTSVESPSKPLTAAASPSSRPADEEPLSPDRLLDMVAYILDTSLTLKAFLTITDRLLADVFSEMHFELNVAALYENFLPYLQTEVKQSSLSSTEKRCVCLKLARISAALVQIVRHIVEPSCISPLVHAKSPDEKAVLVDMFVGVMSTITPYKQFMAALQINYPIEDDFDVIEQSAGTDNLDTTGLEYLQNTTQMLMIDILSHYPDHPYSRKVNPTANIPNGTHNKKQNNKESCSIPKESVYDDFSNRPNENHLEGACAARAPTPPIDELQSLISSVTDLIPDIGEGFVQTCLEEYDFCAELVINALLEDTLPPYLKSMDRNMPRKPTSKPINDDSRWGDLPEIISKISVHQGKKAQELVPLSDEVKKRLADEYGEEEEETEEDKREEIALIAAGLNNPLEYEDEYDDTYDLTVAAMEPDFFVNKQDGGNRNVGNRRHNDEEVNRKSYQNIRPDNFIENPEVVRERQERQRAERQALKNRGKHRGGPPPSAYQRGNDEGSSSRSSEADKREELVKGAPKGRGQNEDTLRERAFKDKHKAQRANHDRRNQADRKRFKTGFF